MPVPVVYRFDWPRANFLTFFLFEPRGVVRLALGAAFLRAARFTFLRSVLSSILAVFATCTSFGAFSDVSGPEIVRVCPEICSFIVTNQRTEDEKQATGRCRGGLGTGLGMAESRWQRFCRRLTQTTVGC